MESPSVIKEALIHYVWKTRQFDHNDLTLTDGRKLSIHDYGSQNSDAGPDFSNGKISIENIQWAGNIEMHSASSMWIKHGHGDDPAYNNVVLHVVYEDDLPVKRKEGSRIPTLELKGRINHKIKENYARLISGSTWIPCEKLIHQVDAFKVKLWIEKVAIERLERKTSHIYQLLEQCNDDWEQACFVLLSRYLGSRVNVLPMELMSKQCDVKILYKNSDNLNTIEAILFGISGLLNSPYKDEYPNTLKNEFEFYRRKYLLKNINPVSWKFARMRPFNFPTLRIAQLSSLLHNKRFLFRSFVEAEDTAAIKPLLQAKASEYWDTHYRFDEESKMQEKRLGNTMIDLIIINVIAPLIFVYGQYLSDEKLKEKALNFLEQVPAESNNITRKWVKLGLQNENALSSQSLIQLKQEYCDLKRCLECSIGNELIRF